MQYDAVILAGGENSSELKKIAPYEKEALIIIGNYPMIYYVYNALRATPAINNIIISGPVDALRNILPRDDKLLFVEGGENAIESFAQAVEIMDKKELTDKVLVVPTDVPFITSEAIEDFLNCCEEQQADFYYPLTRKEVNEHKYPGVVRTYVRLKEGIFTGGNLFLLRSEHIPACLEIGVKLFNRRKNPLAMASLFGVSLVWRYLLGQLSIQMVEKRFSEVVGIRGKGIISSYAEVGVDVDKPNDLQLAQEYLRGTDFSQ